MSSAGSVRPSRSVDDIANLEEQDLGIYVEPGRSGAAILIQAEYVPHYSYSIINFDHCPNFIIVAS